MIQQKSLSRWCRNNIDELGKVDVFNIWDLNQLQSYFLPPECDLDKQVKSKCLQCECFPSEKQYWIKVTLTSHGPGKLWLHLLCPTAKLFPKGLQLPFLTNKTKRGSRSGTKRLHRHTSASEAGRARCSPTSTAVHVTLRHHIAALSLTGPSTLSSPNVKMP